MSWTNGDQIRSVQVNDVLKSRSYDDGSGARRIHETYPAGRKETIAYGGEHMTLPKFMFAGKEYDEATGLYNFGARHYDPRMGVWMSPDPARPTVPSVSGSMWLRWRSPLYWVELRRVCGPHEP